MMAEPREWNECFYKSGPRSLPRPFCQARTRQKSATGEIPQPAVLALDSQRPDLQETHSVVHELPSPWRLATAARDSRRAKEFLRLAEVGCARRAGAVPHVGGLSSLGRFCFIEYCRSPRPYFKEAITIAMSL